MVGGTADPSDGCASTMVGGAADDAAAGGSAMVCGTPDAGPGPAGGCAEAPGDLPGRGDVASTAGDAGSLLSTFKAVSSCCSRLDTF
jgi:hypothetical protein